MRPLTGFGRVRARSHETPPWRREALRNNCEPLGIDYAYSVKSRRKVLVRRTMLAVGETMDDRRLSADEVARFHRDGYLHKPALLRLPKKSR